jgi:DNA-binding response OmpR family regulator
MALILVVDDESDLNNLIRDQLRADGHEVQQAFNGRAAVEAVERRTPDLVVLDLMLPDLDGIAVCRRIRERHATPIIMLTAREQEVDRVLGLEVGADDYVTKPFSMRELRARVRSVLRRVELESQRHQQAQGAVTVGALVLDPDSHQAVLEGRPLPLTRTEFRLLHLLASSPGRAFNRDYLIDWLSDGRSGSMDRAIDTHVTRLRRKLGPLGARIVTVWGVGYRFEGGEG